MAGFAKVRVSPVKRFWRGQPKTRPFQLFVKPEGGDADHDRRHAAPGVGAAALVPEGAAGADRAADRARADLAAAAQADDPDRGHATPSPRRSRASRRTSTTRSARPACRRWAPRPSAGGGGGAHAAPAGDGARAQRRRWRPRRRRRRARRRVVIPGLGNPVDGRLDRDAPAGRRADGTLFVTDFVFSNPNGAEGALVVLRNDTPLLQLRLENFRDYDLHFVTPIVDRARRRAEPLARPARSPGRAIPRSSTPGTCGPERPRPAGWPPSRWAWRCSRLPGPRRRWPRPGRRSRRRRPTAPTPPAAPAAAHRRAGRRSSRRRAGGGFPDDASAEPSISADGRYVAFASSATNIAGGAGAGAREPAVFVRDRQRGSTIRLPLPPGLDRRRAGARAVDLGRRQRRRVHLPAAAGVHGAPAPRGRLGPGDGPIRRSCRGRRGGSRPTGSREPSVSATGRFVAFTSEQREHRRRRRRRTPTSSATTGSAGRPCWSRSASTAARPARPAPRHRSRRTAASSRYVSDGGDVHHPHEHGLRARRSTSGTSRRADRAGQRRASATPAERRSRGAPAISADGNGGRVRVGGVQPGRRRRQRRARRVPARPATRARRRWSR